jgi:hypothetical protein
MTDIEQFIALPEETQRRRLKHLIFETVPDGEVKETAAAMGIEDYTLYKHRDENRDNYDLLHPRLVRLMQQRRDLRILDFLETLFGRVAFTLPQPLESLEGISRHITQVFREASRACQAVIDAAGPESPGGVEITYPEFQRIQAEIREAQRQLAALEEAARQKSAKHPSWPVRLVNKLGFRGQKA